MRIPSQSVAENKAVAGCRTHALQTASAPSDVRVAIVVSRYNHAITYSLLCGAVETLNNAGVISGRIEVAEVPGAFELPLAADALACSGRFAAVLCLGAVTCDTLGQAEARAGGDVGNKGAECAEAAIAMINLLQDVSGQ